MYKVIRKIEFCYGHRLLNHSGPCKYLHGHNARIEVELIAKILNDQGMVRDFFDIKKTIQNWINQTFDHKMILQEGDFMIEVLKKNDEPHFVVPFPPTTENLARAIFDYAKKEGFPVKEVRIWETENSMASYSEV